MDHAHLHARARGRGVNPIVYWVMRAQLRNTNDKLDKLLD